MDQVNHFCGLLSRIFAAGYIPNNHMLCKIDSLTLKTGRYYYSISIMLCLDIILFVLFLIYILSICVFQLRRYYVAGL